MILRKLKGTDSDVMILILLIGIALWISAFVNPEAVSEVKPMPLYGVLLRITGDNPFIHILISFIIVMVTAFLLVDFNTSELFLGERTFLPAVLYILLTGLFTELRTMYPALIASLFLLPALKKIVSTYKVQGTAYHFFDAGLLIGTGTLFYSGFIWFGLLLIAGVSIFRTGSLREILISFFGLLTPWVITAAIYYLTDLAPESLLADCNYNLFHIQNDFRLTPVMKYSLIYLGLIFIISFVHLVSVYNTKKIKARKTFSILMWGFFISAAVILILKSVSFEMIWLVWIPAVYFFSHYFLTSRKKIIPEILFTAILVVVAMVQVLGLIL